MEWYKAAKFGLFIHWGLYAQYGGKYKTSDNNGEKVFAWQEIPVAEYKAKAAEFNPVLFDADAWVQVAKAAGQKYIIFTAKHHDGFAMFRSEASAFNIFNATPFQRDPLKELSEACQKHGLKLGVYYSQAQDWSHKGGASQTGYWDPALQRGSMDAYIDDVALPQVKEILTRYGEIAILWWDTPNDMTPQRAAKFLPLLANQPAIITNNRLGGGASGDIDDTPEQWIPVAQRPGINWEACETMNRWWGYNAYFEEWKTTAELLPKLIDVVSKGGNFLLNVGPDAKGQIPKICVDVLREMGNWLAVNGEAIYGTSASPFQPLSYGRATRKGQKLYLHVFHWPTNGKLNVPFTNTVTKAYLLNDPATTFSLSPEKNRTVISVPPYGPNPLASVVVVEFTGEPRVLPLLSENKPVTASSERDDTHRAMACTDGNIISGWQAAKGDSLGWIEMDLGQPETVAGFSIAEPFRHWNFHQQKLKLSYKVGNRWKMAYRGTSAGTGHTASFVPVTARYFRLDIDSSKYPLTSSLISIGGKYIPTSSLPNQLPAVSEWLLYRAE